MSERSVRPVALLIVSAGFLGAWTHGDSGATCPYGSGGADGCNATTILATQTYTNPTFFTSARLSGQTYTTRPNWNVAGVDPGYNLGPPATQVYKVPGVDTVPTGCIYSPTLYLGAYAGPVFYCSGADPTFDGWNFGFNQTRIVVNSSATGTLTVTNSKFANGPAYAGTANQSWITVGVGSHVNLVMTHNSFDGLGTTYAENYPTANSYNDNAVLTNNSTGTSPGSCTQTIQYNVYTDLPYLPMAGNGTNCNIDIAFNYFYNWLANPAQTGHAATYALTPSSNGVVTSATYRYNTYAFGMVNTNTTTAISFLGAATLHNVFTTATADHNTIVSNKSGGAGGSAAAGAALVQALHLASIGDLTLTNNYVDPTGALACMTNTGDAFNVAATVSNGSGGNGTTVNVTGLGTSGHYGIYEGAFFGTTAGDPSGGTIATYGTTSPDTGLATTGTGGAGTYVLSGAPAQNRTASTFSTFNNPITGTTTVSGNINLTDGSTITKSGVQWNAGTCNNNF